MLDTMDTIRDTTDMKQEIDCEKLETKREETPNTLTELASPEELRKVVRKLDLHLLPLCFILYTFSVLDRSNLGNARLAGLDDDLNLSSGQYSWLGTCFYIAYILFQFSTLGWKIFQPHIWVACVVFSWGTISTMQATCTSWGGLMACRFLLGVAETMFGPGIPLYFSYFYPREYAGLRFGIFLSGAALANAYGGALAYGLSHISSSIPNWKFLFIIEGVPSALLAIVCFFFLPDRPETARFLNTREREVASAFARNQPGDFDKPSLDVKQLGDAFKDYRNWLFAWTNFSTNVSFASLPLFLPTIIEDLGSFNALTSNGLSAPPYLLCFFVMITTAFLSDHFKVRGPFASAFAAIASAGYLILALTSDVASRYVGIFMVVLIFTTVALILVWNANTNENESKRAGGVWIMQTVGQCGTLVGTNVFPSSDSPYYRHGMWVGFSFSMTATLATALLSFLLWRENKRRDRKYGKVDAAQLFWGDLNGEPAEARVRFVI